MAAGVLAPVTPGGALGNLLALADPAVAAPVTVGAPTPTGPVPAPIPAPAAPMDTAAGREGAARVSFPLKAGAEGTPGRDDDNGSAPCVVVAGTGVAAAPAAATLLPATTGLGPTTTGEPSVWVRDPVWVWVWVWALKVRSGVLERGTAKGNHTVRWVGAREQGSTSSKDVACVS
jgi:hypothetical protein